MCFFSFEAVPFYSVLLQHFHLAEVLRPASLSQLPICNFYKFYQTAALIGHSGDTNTAPTPSQQQSGVDAG